MKRLFTLTGSLLCATAMLSAWADGSVTNIQGPAAGMSPDGTKIVGTLSGYDKTWTYLTHKSFLWDATKGTQWLTEYDGTGKDCAKSGIFKAVNNSGMIAGAIKDPTMRLPVSGGGIFAPSLNGNTPAKADQDEQGMPICHAAVWRDGELYVLEGGLEDISAYELEEDGSYALGISEDGILVVGQTMKSYYPSAIMGWQYISELDKYVHVDFSVPERAVGASMYGIAPSGLYIYGTVIESLGEDVGNFTIPVVWTKPDKYAPIELPDLEKYTLGSGICAMSPDGNLLLVYGSGFDKRYLGVYNAPEGSLTEVPIPAEIFDVTGYTITNDGCIFLSMSDSTWKPATYYYDPNIGNIIPIAEYLSECAADVAGASSLVSYKPSLVNYDGSAVAFVTTNDYGQPTATSLLQLTTPRVLSLSAPTDIKLHHSAYDQLTCRWSGVPVVPEGLELRGYEVVINGKVVATEPATEAGGTFAVTTEGRLGSTHIAKIRTLYTKDGEEKASALSVAAKAYLPNNRQLLSFDNFDDCELDDTGNPIYVREDWYVDESIVNPLVITWSLSVRDWDNNNPYQQLTSIATTPWACALASRYHNATQHEGPLYLSFYVQNKEVNEFGQDRYADYLDVEYTTDGHEWKLLKNICAGDMTHAKWAFHSIDVADELNGKEFQIRFNAHGQGDASMIWALDLIGLSDKQEAPAPADIRMLSYSEQKGLELTWTNTADTWDHSYMINSYVEADANAGNDGKPIMMAIEFEPQDIEPYVGEYINGVSAFLYDMPDTGSPTSEIEAVVYTDGKEVARKAFVGPFDKPTSYTAWLDEPIKIEEGKTYRLAINLKSYNAQYPPLYYQNVDEFVIDKTDLYSEDDGKHFWSMYEEFEYIYSKPDQSSLLEKGKCIWSIHADITADGTPITDKQKDAEIIGYNVYRNGEQISKMVSYAPYMKYVDPTPVDKAAYTVQAFYHDGRISPMSAPFIFDAAGVEQVYAPIPAVSVQGGMLNAGIAYDKAELYTLGGVKVASAKGGAAMQVGTLGSGLYLLRIEAGDLTYAVKVIL